MVDRRCMRLEIEINESSWGQIARLVVRDSPVPMNALMDPSVASRPSSAIKRRVICRRFELVEPRFSLIEQPWKLEPIASPPELSAASLISISEADQLAYMAFAESSRAENGGQALAALPDGNYWLVRRSLPNSRSSTLQLCNDIIPLPPYADVVLDREDFYAAAFGAAAPPTYERPLVGIPVFAYRGDGRQDALLLFDVGAEASPSHTSSKARTGDAVFVIPTDPAFMLANRDDVRPRPTDSDILVRRFIAERPILCR